MKRGLKRRGKEGAGERRGESKCAGELLEVQVRRGEREKSSVRCIVRIWYVVTKNTYHYAHDVVVRSMVRILWYVVVRIIVHISDCITAHTGTYYRS